MYQTEESWPSESEKRNNFEHESAWQRRIKCSMRRGGNNVRTSLCWAMGDVNCAFVFSNRTARDTRDTDMENDFSFFLLFSLFVLSLRAKVDLSIDLTRFTCPVLGSPRLCEHRTRCNDIENRTAATSHYGYTNIGETPKNRSLLLLVSFGWNATGHRTMRAHFPCERVCMDAHKPLAFVVHTAFTSTLFLSFRKMWHFFRKAEIHYKT